MDDNLKIYNAVKKVPDEAKSAINGGRLKIVSKLVCKIVSKTVSKLVRKMVCKIVCKIYI